MAYVSDDEEYNDDAFEAAGSPTKKQEKASPASSSFAAPAPAADGFFFEGPAAPQETLRVLEDRVNERLQLLERVKRCDIHASCWAGEEELVRAHLELAGTVAARAARLDLRVARKSLERLRKEASALHGKGSDDEGCADEMEIGVAYAEQVDSLAETVEAAERSVVKATLDGSASCANLIDETEFGDGYRPLHYAAYNGRASIVALLLDFGAIAETQNSAGCTPLFLATQQGKEEAARCLLAVNEQKWCHKSQLASTGEGRDLSAIDVVRSVDCKSAGRRECRSMLLEDLATQPERGKPVSRKRPTEELLPSASPAPELVGHDMAHRELGGLEVRWAASCSSSSELQLPPSHHAKVKIVDREGQTAALLVARASTGSLRIALDDSKLVAGLEYAASIAFVNGVGSAAYSPLSPFAIAAKTARLRPVDAPQPARTRGLDPKIARARQAVEANRQKRHRVQGILAQQHKDQQGPLPAFPKSPSVASSRGDRGDCMLDDLGPVVTLPIKKNDAFVDLDDDVLNCSSSFAAPAPAFQFVSPSNSPNNLSTRDTDDQHFKKSPPRSVN